MTKFGRARLGAALAAASAVFLGTAAFAAELTVTLDEGRMLTFRTPVKTVFVGNPLIADVTVVDEKHVFITGKHYGSTNLVVLNETGSQIANERITVHGKLSNVVTLQRGGAQTTLVCAAERCVPAPTQGDAKPLFDELSDEIEARETLSRGAAAAGMAAQEQ
jgi:hypothetical protein